MDAGHFSSDIPIRRLRDGFVRLATVLRAEEWSAANAAGLTPTQVLVLALLADRGSALRVKTIAAHLCVSQPSVTDTIAALERKGLISKGVDAADARAAAVALTAAGRDSFGAIRAAVSPLEVALSALTATERTNLLDLQIKVIRALQEAGAIPVQRMCVTCVHFRPFAHAKETQPHHCAFVDAAFGRPDLRLECGDHEAADPAVRTAIWSVFMSGPPPLPANHPVEKEFIP